MSVKRKISARKIIQALLTLVLAVVTITAVLSATKLQKSRTLAGVDILIKNKQYRFVTEQEIEQTLLRDGEIKPGKTKLSKLNIRQMEKVVVANPWVEDAQVYVDNKQNLHALVVQRAPVARIFERNGNSYYIDRQMEILPLSNKYNYYTTVVTNVPELKNDSASNALKAQIMALVQYIRRDTFWNQQVSQLIVRDDMQFEIVPVLGEHQIILGDTADMRLKFDNLFAFYNKVLNEVGWDKYNVLDLSYKGQLVASPALKWKLPVDKVINRINWVSSITGETPAPKPVAIANNTPAATAPAEVKAETPSPATPEKPIQAEVKAEVKVGPKPAAKTERKAPPKKTEPKQPKPEQKAEKKQEDKKPKYIYGGN
jgi:cell division protein FtsQ